MILFFPSCTGALIIKKVKFFTVFELYLHWFSNLLFCDIWSSFSTQNDPFILKHYSLIVTVTVYGVPRGLCVNLDNNYIQWTYYLKRITSCLFAYLHVCK